MRIVKLPEAYEDANEMFSLLFTAAMAGSGPKTIDEARNLAKLQDTLEDAGDEVTAADNESPDQTRWVLKKKQRELKLEDAHWRLLKQRIFGAEIAWTAAVSRKVQRAYDLLEEAEEAKPK